MLKSTNLIRKTNLRRFSSSSSSRIEDEGDWFYSPEWWTRKADSRTVFSQVSDKGNGVVSVASHPSSKPDIAYWGRMEDWLRQRYTQIYPGSRLRENFKVAGYQWRTLHFNDDTRESTAKVMAAYKESDPDSLYLMQQAHCLAVPYVKSMISTGLMTLAHCNFDLQNAIRGVKKMKVLCIGHGGGSIPLFLASKILGAEVDTVDIDPAVVSASIQAMGFPSVSIVKTSGHHASSQQLFDDLFWRGVRERITLYELDAEDFILQYNNLYDIVFIDAYDADDIFPRKFWDPNSPFLKALSKKVHPKHGTVVVNLHADMDLDVDPSNLSPNSLPMGRYISEIASAFKHMLIDNSHSRCPGLAYTVPAPWVCNTSLVIARCSDDLIGNSENIILNSLISRSLQVDKMLNMPFSCLPYIKRGLLLSSEGNSPSSFSWEYGMGYFSAVELGICSRHRSLEPVSQ